MSLDCIDCEARRQADLDAIEDIALRMLSDEVLHLTRYARFLKAERRRTIESKEKT